MKTKIGVSDGKNLARKWGFSGCIGVDCEGLNGGLLLMWDQSIMIEARILNKNLICAYVEEKSHKFLFTTIYGHPILKHRQEVWNQLIAFSQTISPNEEWVVLGDFNQVSSTEDKKSFKSLNLRGADSLKECLDNCGLDPIKTPFDDLDKQ
ncbi:hypothetical protein PTKIN_Ptkin05aG0135400 [Pterospermum kingtungense]